MKALFYEKQQGYQGIISGDLPIPATTSNEVLVRVHAFSLNHLDLWVMSENYPVRVALPHIFGSDASGVVERVGPGIDHVKTGDEVIIFPGLSCGYCDACLSGRDNECNSFSLLGVRTNGVSAEYVNVPAANVFPKPAGLSFEEAACFGITYTTAWNSLVLRAGIRQGDTVLVHAAGSGAGSALIQVAKLFHANVITTVGDDWKIERAKALGADHVIQYRKEDFVEAVKRITDGNLTDIAVDHIGAATFNKSLSCLKKGGTLITFGATSGDEIPLSLRYVFGKNLRIHGVYVGPKAAMKQYLKLFGHVRPVIDSVFAFNDIYQAYEKMLSRRVFGKIVVRVL
ncbi:MAG TPA: zinc-binding dehydrogenase [Nitrospirota bacterium]|nr:zinc-binding dehydrogenase [Nitrospirota bacterium]